MHESLTCCCCFPIRGGTIFLGVVELILIALSVTSRVLYIVYPEDAVSSLNSTGEVFAEPEISNTDVDKYFSYVQLAVNGVQAIVTVLMIVGVVNWTQSLLIPHLVVQVLNNVFATAQAAVVCLSYGITWATLAQAVAWALYILITTYFIYVVYSCYKFIKFNNFVQANPPNGTIIVDQSQTSHSSSYPA